MLENKTRLLLITKLQNANDVRCVFVLVAVEKVIVLLQKFSLQSSYGIRFAVVWVSFNK